MSIVNPVVSLVAPWYSSPNNTPWRWVTNATAQQKISVVPTNAIKPEEKNHASLAKVFNCMRNALNGTEQQYVQQQNAQDGLIRLRDVVEQRYEKYCSTYCIFAQIWEIFISIFPGRMSTWMEHRRLIRTIDLKIGAIDQNGKELFDPKVLQLIVPIQKQLDKLKNELSYKTPSRLLAAMVVRHNDKVLHRLHPTFDQIFNNPADDPRKFFDMIEACVKKLPTKISGLPSIRELNVVTEVVMLTKADRLPGSPHLFNMKQICNEMMTQSPIRGESESPYIRCTRDATYQSLAYDQKSLQGILKLVQMPPSIMDANGNFA